MSTEFKFPHFSGKVTYLRTQLLDRLKSSDDVKVRGLISDVPNIHNGRDSRSNDRSCLTVAFIGQYDSGKSTIISALTGRDDIPIDPDVCTDKVTAYNWNGILILDTPGIHSGYPEHDTKTYAAIDQSDLLVFVITNELFDDIIGAHFRDLCFERNKGSETLLVVNKMSQDPGTPEVKLPNIASVTTPLTPDDFRTTFIDAESFIDAYKEDLEEDRWELLEISNFPAFVDTLNRFVRDKGLMGRLTTPLFEMRAVAQQAEALLTVDMPEERAAIELLNRKRGLLLDSRSRLRSVMRGLVSAAASDLVAFGDAVAESVEPGSSEESVQALHKDAQRQARARCDRLSSDSKTAIESELAELARQLEALEHGVLASELKDQVALAMGTVTKKPHHNGSSSDIQWEGRTATTPSDWAQRVIKVGGVADGVGKYAARWATGPLAEGARIGSATASRGSQAHQVVYNVGKFFGVKFKPWGAVKIARGIGNAGRVIAAVGGVLAVVAQVYEDKQLEEYRIQLREARNTIRTAYRESVSAIEGEFWNLFEKFARDFYDSELAAVDETVSSFVGQRVNRSDEARSFADLASEATKQIEAIQADAAR